jgi:succinate dehydrogenase/fumarate reductase flavoprotein subunit
MSDASNDDLAGLRPAIAAAEVNPKLSVAVVSKELAAPIS